MDYKTAVKRKNTCITLMLILIMWGWGGIRSHIQRLKDSPETGLLIFGGLFGIPILFLFIMAVIYSIKAKKLEYDEWDDEPEVETTPNSEEEKQD